MKVQTLLMKKQSEFFSGIKVTLLLIVILLSVFHLQAQFKQKNPKNIILMIGDGMGYNQLMAAVYYLYGDTSAAFWVKDGFVGLAQATYPAILDNKKDTIYNIGYNVQAAYKNPLFLKEGYTDSGAAATALATGKKTYNHAIGVDVLGDSLLNVTEWAKVIGKSAGVVTTVPISHATPAGFSVHSVNRKKYNQIAQQQLFNSKLDVLMGCGNPDYNKNGMPQKMEADYVGGDKVWEQLKTENGKTTFQLEDKTITVQDIDGDKKPDAWHFIQDSAGFASLANGNTPKRVLGLPMVYETLQQTRDFSDSVNRVPFRTPFNKKLPSLNLMVKGALNVLDNNKKGFFLMVEGGAIDWACHDNQSDRMIEETADFLSTIDTVIAWVERNSNWNETLLIVTADHETGFLQGHRVNDTFLPVRSKGKGQMPAMLWNSDEHSNSLVPVFAKGCGSSWLNFFADEYDPGIGYYIQNTEIAKTIFLLWGR